MTKNLPTKYMSTLKGVLGETAAFHIKEKTMEVKYPTGDQEELVVMFIFALAPDSKTCMN